MVSGLLALVGTGFLIVAAWFYFSSLWGQTGGALAVAFASLATAGVVLWIAARRIS